MSASLLAPPPFGTLTTQVYQQSYAAIAWLQGVLSATGASGNPASLATQANLVLQTLLNGVQILGANDLYTGLLADYPLLQEVASLPILYTSGQNAAINARLVGIANLEAQLETSIPYSITGAASGYLNLGTPAIADIGLLTALSGWVGEPIPAGFTNGNIFLTAEQNVQDWQQISSGVANYFGNSPDTSLDAAVRAAQGTAASFAIISGLALNDASNSVLSAAQVWNTAFALPATTTSARLLAPNLSLDASQSSMVTRSFCLAMAQQLAGFVVLANGLASTAAGNNANSVVVQQNQGLMDIAAANLGSFESWQQLVSGVSAPWGRGALPTGLQITLTSGYTGLTQAAILGTDINLGPQNQAMQTWTGDFSLNVGLNNYRASLGRRLATTLGALIYHTNFGSRIPPLLGQIMTTGSQALITAYGNSALSSDPRTQSVLSATTASISGVPNAVAFSATVQPIGPDSNAVQVNEVLTP